MSVVRMPATPPTGSFFTRFFVLLWRHLAERMWSVSVAWEDKPRTMALTAMLAIIIVVLQALHQAGIWP